MDRPVHGRTTDMDMDDGRSPWTAIKINKHRRPLAPKIGILTILMSPVTLQLFLCLLITALCLLW